MLAVETIYEEALTMKPTQKAELIEKLIVSLDMPNQAIQSQWNNEAEDRLNAYENAEIKSIEIKKVFSKYEV